MNYIARNLGRSGRSFRNGNRRCRMASGAITTIIQTPFWGNDKTESLISSCNSSRYLSTTSSSTSSTNDNHRKNKKPFDKVLIANRGEIVQRVVRTCRELGIQTVAVYSTADAQAPFVQEADEAVCLGPAPASQSYLNTQAILRTIHDTGAQAVHPGYGFLSENANFAKIIAENNAVWLGPPARAISQMGDKLASKLIAHKAGVTIVPGHETPMESLEQAMQLCEDGIVPYPVLLKAAAGGGGKGMRVCFNSQDLKEAWNVSKAESLQFFGDDRLLLEKYIENPHHIEFQVMCSPSPPPSSSDGNAAATTTTTDVVVFPERECSIQRRNQKIIEESPSMLLTEETRNTMIEQVVRLCQTVGYESAGTLEFLVDEQQNFYFLEMNTRLQVEHCVSEEAVGDARNRKIDLVKAMLWIGAGWGFPEEIEQMRDGFIIRPTRHAIEARIYAEDPTRAFLPSTGPLLPYVEPTTSPTLRVDSGVAEGHVVTPHYDPMLSKVIASSDTLGSSITAKSRNEAIETLKHALDEYVIEGVQHNARLIQAVLRNNAFVRGETPTSFLPTHFPDGFHGVELTTSEKEEFAVAAVLIDTTRRTLLRQPPLVGRTTSDTQGLVVRLGGFFGDPYLVHIKNGDGSNQASITVERLQKADESESNDVNKRRTLLLDAPINFQHNRHLAQVSLDGVPRNVQVIGENKTGEIKMQMYGWDTSILVQSPREYELSKYMKPPVQVDTSSLLQSPMPGTLISLAVQEGDQVETGHELCIVEAMKMQNILKSPRNGTIAKIRVQVGESLKADQVILEFETE
ncbi:hypothetical protein ACA910_008323 [Epithemia clementina (nom. ined.)]